LIAMYPNKFYITLVSESSDTTSFYYFNANYETYKKYSFKNDIRCSQVANAKPSDIKQINTTVTTVPPPPQ